MSFVDNEVLEDDTGLIILQKLFKLQILINLLIQLLALTFFAR